MKGVSQNLYSPPSNYEYEHSRIVLVEFAEPRECKEMGQRCTRQLAENISDMTTNVDPVVVTPDQINMSDPATALERGRISLDTLRMASERYGGQAVMLGEITQFSPYASLSAGVRIKIFSTSDASLETSVSENYSADDPQFRSYVKDYYERRSDSEACRFGPHLLLTSPRYFTLVVTDNIVREHIVGKPAGN